MWVFPSLLPFLPPPPGMSVCGLQWNPGTAELLAVSLSSGGLYVLEVVEDVRVVVSHGYMGAVSRE